MDLRISRPHHSIVRLSLNLPSFAMYQAFPDSDYYDGSVTVGLSSFRPSRVYVQETLSTCRCPFRFLPPFISGYSLSGAFRVATTAPLCRTVSSLQVCCDGCKMASLETWVQPIQASPCVQDLRNRSAYIPSGLSAFLTCYFPLCLSTRGRSGVLRGISLHPLPP